MAKSFKRRIRMEKAIYMEANGFKDREIANVLRLSKGGLAQLKRDPEYQGLRVQLASGVVSEFNKDIALDRTFLREKLKEMVPVALQGLYEAATNKRNERVRFEACKTILNREGTLAEVSKSTVVVQDERTTISKADDEAADALVKAYKASGGDTLPPPITDIVQ